MSEDNIIEFPEPKDASPAGGWLSMDSAPYDGTPIWVVSEGKRFIAYYSTVWSWKKFRVVKKFTALFEMDGPFSDPNKTYPTDGWAPIPDRPEPTDVERGNGSD